MTERPRRFRLASINGIEVFIHSSWLLIAGLILLGFWGWLQLQHPGLDGPALAGLSLLGTLVFFGSVLLHELAHAFVARRRGIEVEGITLYLFGGATEADASSRSAGDEFVIAIVGPVTSVLIAAALGLGALTFGAGGEPLPDLLAYLAAINLILAAFNMAPGLPLDGGRVFRSAVWAITDDFEKATRWATTAGVMLGYGLIGAGLLSLAQGAVGGLWLMAIGWMISQSARQNQYQEGLRAAFTGLTAGDLMTSPVVTIPATVSIADAVRDYFARRQLTAFPVVDGDRILGLLTVSAVRAVPATETSKTTAGAVAVAHQPALVAEIDTPMSDVLAALSTSTESSARVLVADGGRLTGIISPTDIVRRQTISTLPGARPSSNPIA